MSNIINLNPALSISTSDINDLVIKLKSYAKSLDKDTDEITYENIKHFINDIGNRNEYLLSKYPSDYSYRDFVIDTLESNIKYL